MGMSASEVGMESNNAQNCQLCHSGEQVFQDVIIVDGVCVTEDGFD